MPLSLTLTLPLPLPRTPIPTRYVLGIDIASSEVEECERRLKLISDQQKERHKNPPGDFRFMCSDGIGIRCVGCYPITLTLTPSPNPNSEVCHPNPEPATPTLDSATPTMNSCQTNAMGQTVCGMLVPIRCALFLRVERGAADVHEECCLRGGRWRAFLR
jgi:hypothetical protein